MRLPRVSPRVQYEIVGDPMAPEVLVSCEVEGRLLRTRVVLPDRGLDRHPDFANYAVESAVRDLERTVGAYLVRGEVP